MCLRFSDYLPRISLRMYELHSMCCLVRLREYLRKSLISGFFFLISAISKTDFSATPRLPAVQLLALPRVQPACCGKFRAALHGGPTPNGDGVDKIRVVDDRKLAWRAHPWPAWAVGRLRPSGCLRSFPSCGPSATPTECFHVVVSSSGVRRL